MRSSSNAAGVPTLPELALVGLERRLVGLHVAQQPGQAHRGARLEVAVVPRAAQAVDELLGAAGHARAHRSEHRVGRPLRSTACSMTSRASRKRHGRTRRWPAPPRSRRGDPPSSRARTPARGRPGGTPMAAAAGEADVAVVGHHDRRRLVRPVDRHLLADVVGGGARQTGGAHEDQRLGGQVDVLLVLGDVAGDRLVAELAELDPHLFGRHVVDTVADDRPVALRRCEPAGGVGDQVAAGEHGAHRVGQRRAAR